MEGRGEFRAFCSAEVRLLGLEEGRERLRGSLEDPEGTVLVASSGTVSRLGMEALAPEGIRIVSGFSSDPTVDDLRGCLTALSGRKVERLVCVGGGSTIDMGKALCAMLGMEGGAPESYDGLCEAIQNKRYVRADRGIELIAFPTTAGTGSEVTPWATIWDLRGDRKLSVDMPALTPDLAAVVPGFTTHMPARLTLSTGLDALAQAMESFWSRARDPLCQALALEGIRRIRTHLPAALSRPGEMGHREGMCLGALLSGLAFSRTRTTACHSISYPITIRHGVEHGLAVAVTLEEVARIDRSAVPEIERIYDIFGGPQGLHRWLEETSRPIQPLRLSAMGITAQDLPALVDGAFTQGRMDNNPVPLGREDVEGILRRVL